MKSTFCAVKSTFLGGLAFGIVSLPASTVLGDGWNIDVIDSGADVGRYSSLAFDPSGKMTISYYDATDLDGDGDPGDLRLWHDDNGNDLFDDGEARTIDSLGDAGYYTSLAFDPAGHATVAYYDGENADLKLWHDADGDFYFDAGEIQTIDSGGEVGHYPSLAFDGSGNATISYFDDANNDLKLWHDADGDFEFDASEIEVIDDEANHNVSSLAFDSSGHATVSYRGPGPEYIASLRVWHDANGDFASDPSEIEVIDSEWVQPAGQYSSLAFDADGYATVSYLKGDTGYSLYLWHDANGDFAFDGGEIQGIASPFYGDRTFLKFDASGKATVAFYAQAGGTDSTGSVWHDADGDFASDAGEVQVIDELYKPGSLAFDGSGRAAVTGISVYGFRLWHDTDGDFAYDEGEVQQVDQPPSAVGKRARLAFDASGRVTVAYRDSAAGIKLWHDANNNLGSDPGEIGQNVVGTIPRLMFDSSGFLILAYWDWEGEVSRLWYDANGNFIVDAGEIHTIQTGDTAGWLVAGDFALDLMGRLTVAYRASSAEGYELRVWHDADDNFTADPGEIETIDENHVAVYSISLAFDASEHATVSYGNDTSGDLKLWHDADGNFAFDDGEIQTIDSVGGLDPGKRSSLAFDPSGRAVISYRGTGTNRAPLDLWYDANGDFAFDMGEIRTIESLDGVYVKFTDLAFDGSGRAVVVYRVGSPGGPGLRVWGDTDGDFTFDPGEIEVITTDVGADMGQLGFRDSDQLAVIAYYSPDFQALMLASHLDWDGDGVEIPNDNCRLFNPDQIDCQPNGVGDVCDIADGTSQDSNGNGIPDECEGAIPTVSEWGLIVMAVLVLVAGTLVFLRRRPARV